MSELLSYQFYEQHLPQQIEVFGGPNFFPADLTADLIALSDSSSDRRQEFDFPYPLQDDPATPAVITAAARWADSLMPSTTARLTRYDINGTYQSSAHQPHRDPAIYGSQRIALISLSGEAELIVRTSDDTETSILCLPRTALFLAPDIIHSISEPKNLDGIRHFLFLGYKDPML